MATKSNISKFPPTDARQQITLRSRQLNPYDHLFWKSRGYPERPWNWQDILEETGYYNNSTESEEDEYDDEYDEEYDDEYSDEDEYGEDDEYDDEYEEEEEEYYEDEYDSDEYDSDYEEYRYHRSKSNGSNPNNDEFWRLRGYVNGRPDNWREIYYGR